MTFTLLQMLMFLLLHTFNIFNMQRGFTMFVDADNDNNEDAFMYTSLKRHFYVFSIPFCAFDILHLYLFTTKEYK